MRNLSFSIPSIFRVCAIVAFSAVATLCGTHAHADAPVDTPEVKAVRDLLLDWDKNDPKMSLEEARKCYHTTNDKEATFFDYIAHENWEEAKLQQAVRDKWGAQAEAKFAHYQGGSTLEDDQICQIKVDGDHATVTWPDIKDATPLQLIKVDGKWLVDGHALYEEAVKDDPTKAPAQPANAKLYKQAAADIVAGKFDDVDEFISDFKAKSAASTDGN
jgi:hypothetical protein